MDFEDHQPKLWLHDRRTAANARSTLPSIGWFCDSISSWRVVILSNWQSGLIRRPSGLLLILVLWSQSLSDRYGLMALTLSLDLAPITAVACFFFSTCWGNPNLWGCFTSEEKIAGFEYLIWSMQSLMDVGIADLSCFYDSSFAVSILF